MHNSFILVTVGGLLSLIILVRHGESEGNIIHILSDYLNKYPLTPTGIAQVTTTANELKKLKITDFFTSPILRTRQTADIIKSKINIKPKIDFNLTERRFKKMRGSFVTDNSWKLSAKNKIEPFESLQKRMASFINENSGKNVVLGVTHHDPIVATISYAINSDEYGSFSFRPTYASITIFEIFGNRIKLILSGVPYLTEDMLMKIPKKYLRIE